MSLDGLIKLLVMLMPCCLARFMWGMAEQRGISLGRFAPHIFGRMLGNKITWRKGAHND